MSHRDESWWFSMTNHESSWCIRMNYHGSRSIKMNKHDSSWWIIMMHNDDASWWCLRMIHHDNESWWSIMMNHRVALQGFLSGLPWPFLPWAPWINATHLQYLPWPKPGSPGPRVQVLGSGSPSPGPRVPGPRSPDRRSPDSFLHFVVIFKYAYKHIPYVVSNYTAI